MTKPAFLATVPMNAANFDGEGASYGDVLTADGNGNAEWRAYYQAPQCQSPMEFITNGGGPSDIGPEIDLVLKLKRNEIAHDALPFVVYFVDLEQPWGVYANWFVGGEIMVWEGRRMSFGAFANIPFGNTLRIVAVNYGEPPVAGEIWENIPPE